VRITSTKSSKTRKIAYGIGGLVLLFYLVTTFLQVSDGNADWETTMWNMLFFLGYVIFIHFIIPAEYFEFRSNEIEFRPMAGFKHETLKVSEIDHIAYDTNRVFMVTADKKHEASLTSFSYDEIQSIKQQLANFNIEERQPEIEDDNE
jgi:hypothetical protein